MGYEDIKKRMIESEGNITHMYLDTKGKVTVGIGAMLPDVNAAKKIGFVTRDKKLKVTLKQIEPVETTSCTMLELTKTHVAAWRGVDSVALT